MRSNPIIALAVSLVLGAALGGCVDEGPALGEAEGAESVWQWTDDVPVPDLFSTRQVALTWWNSKVQMVYTHYQSANPDQLRWARFDGTAWSTEHALNQNTDTNPALASFNNRLYLIFKPSGQNRFMMMSTAASTWTTPVTVGRSIGSNQVGPPSALAYGGNLYLAYCGRDTGGYPHVFVDRWNGTTWSAFHDFRASTFASYTCRGVVLAAMPDTGAVELIYNLTYIASGSAAAPVYRKRAVITANGTTWSAAEQLRMTSYKPMSVVSCGGKTHLVHGGASSSSLADIWWSYRSGGDWVDALKVPNQQSGAGAALGCFADTTAIMVHNPSGATQLSWSYYDL